jgi:hypothetical protein
MNKSQFARLCAEREELLAQLAPTLKRAGPHHPNRNAVNRQRAAQRKKIRKQLEAVDNEIVNRVVTMVHANLEIK